MGTFFIVIIVLYFILFAFGFLSYVFNSMGLYVIAKNEVKPPYFLAWIPYLNKYTLGKIAFNSEVQAVIMVIMNLISFALTTVTLIISADSSIIYILLILIAIFSVINAIFNYVARYFIYSRYSKSTVIMTIFDVLSCGILGPIFVFAIRNNELKK